MRFQGSVVGHKTTHNETQCLLDDHDNLDNLKIPFEKECEQDDQMETSNDGHTSQDQGSEVEDKSGNEDIEMETSDNDEEGTLLGDNLMDEMEEFGVPYQSQISNLGLIF
ncbi:hypothetical protein PAXINDRAFT_155272 [Paxillus involutus ATCC 200175]|nr:hypothetical protein PAXINDRAFT_155272 [Paxillus involutus ATCC 200175]